MNIFFQRAGLDSPHKYTDSKTNYFTDNVGSEDSDCKHRGHSPGLLNQRYFYKSEVGPLEPLAARSRQKGKSDR